MDQKTLALLVELKGYADDPAAFAELRQKVLQSYFESVDPTGLSRLLTLQDDIEATSAVEGTPVRALKTLMENLKYQCDALAHVQQQLND